MKCPSFVVKVDASGAQDSLESRERSQAKNCTSLDDSLRELNATSRLAQLEARLSTSRRSHI